MLNRRILPLGALALAVMAPAAEATLGIFEHGYGIKSMGAAGVAYGFAEDTIALSANPAHALSLGDRYDIGYDVFSPLADARIHDVPGQPDGRYRTDAKRYYGVPQVGLSLRLNERWAFGMTAFAAGLGPDYPDSPYARYGGASRTSLGLGQAGISFALAHALTPGQHVGVAANVGYQTLMTKGLEPFTAVSVDPDHVTNQGKDGSLSGGFTVGWIGELAPGFKAALSYRSKSWTQRHREYRGLIAEGGKLELPAMWGGGLTYKPVPEVVLAFDYQRVEYASERAIGNGLAQLNEGHLLGSDQGPGFGWADQNVYKFAVIWSATPQLDLRLGYLGASQIVQASDTLFAFLGCVTLTTHYSVGASYKFGKWDVSGYTAWAPKQTVRGENSIPAAFGGGEADIGNEVYMMGLSFGRRFSF